MTKPSRWEWHPPTHQKKLQVFLPAILEVDFDRFHKPDTIQLILLGQWLNFKPFGITYLYSRENKVYTFISGSIG